jgi:glycosyltransferase involved in cell wall biosynthesis
MGIAEDRIFGTAHWAEPEFTPQSVPKPQILNGVKSGQPVLLYAGRLSEEKGIMQLPHIFRSVQAGMSDVQMVVAGEGPAEQKLRAALPDALYLGWLNQKDLAALYSAADLFVLPSRFDTFGCAVLEAMSCGLPVIAYNTKGPRDIIRDGINGFLVERGDEFPNRILRFLHSARLQRFMRRAALSRSSEYSSERILNQLLRDLGLMAGEPGSPEDAQPGERKELRPRPNSALLEELLEIVTDGP